jgi:hypothetical protein
MAKGAGDDGSADRGPEAPVLGEAVPDDHLVRKVDAVVDLCWVYAELASHYSRIGRPSIDPVLMIRMLIAQLSVRHSIGTTALPGGSS